MFNNDHSPLSEVGLLGLPTCSSSPLYPIRSSSSLMIVLITICLICGCSDFFDPITLSDALKQDYDLTTAFYGIQVSIDNSVEESDRDILNRIDTRSRSFLNCQFMEGEDIGFMDFELPNGVIVPPLFQMRVWVVDFTFECEAEDKDICGGIYYSSEDLMIIAEESIGRCGLIPLYKHELAHRYGLLSNHRNQDDFDFCSEPPDCDIFREMGRIQK